MLQSGEISYTYRSSGEQRERLTEAIHHLPDRVYYCDNKLANEITRVRTPNVVSPSETLGMTEDEGAEYISNLPIGSDAEPLESEVGDFPKKLLPFHAGDLGPEQIG